LIINDAVDVALEMGAEGIHVGRSDEPPSSIRRRWPKCIGYSLEFLEQLESEEVKVADYLGISPVFSTPTKTDTVTEWGLSGIRKIRSLTRLPLVAIGGIHAHNAEAVLAAGADSLAVVSAICSAENPAAVAAHLKSFFPL
jgi:thiamine-phosphate pyrophosphorylase